MQHSTSLKIQQNIPAMSSSYDEQQPNFTTTNMHSTVKQTPGNTVIEASHRKQPSQGSPSPKLEDSGFFEDEESNIPRADYEDFILFSQTADTSFRKDILLADADSSTVANQGSFYEGENNEYSQIGREVPFTNQHIPPRRAEFFDAVRDAIQQPVNQAITADLTQTYEDQPQLSRSPPPTPYLHLRPLELWEHSYERHESIAYRFEQPPHQVRAKRFRQPRS